MRNVPVSDFNSRISGSLLPWDGSPQGMHKHTHMHTHTQHTHNTYTHTCWIYIRRVMSSSWKNDKMCFLICIFWTTSCFDANLGTLLSFKRLRSLLNTNTVVTLGTQESPSSIAWEETSTHWASTRLSVLGYVPGFCFSSLIYGILTTTAWVQMLLGKPINEVSNAQHWG